MITPIKRHAKHDKICVIHVGSHKIGSSPLQEFLLGKTPNLRAFGALKRDNYEELVFPHQREFEISKLCDTCAIT